jgi:hypothetical protein
MHPTFEMSRRAIDVDRINGRFHGRLNWLVRCGLFCVLTVFNKGSLLCAESKNIPVCFYDVRDEFALLSFCISKISLNRFFL